MPLFSVETSRTIFSLFRSLLIPCPTLRGSIHLFCLSWILKKPLTVSLGLAFIRAYLSWIFLINLLVGFVPCIINGNHFSFFPSKQGIRQWDPLSPYLFVIISNILSILLKERVEQNLITPFKTRGGVRISHLMYVDDLILSFRANPKSCRNL